MEYPDYLKSTLLSRAGFAHAFFTRRGGVSRGAFESLNLSPAVGDVHGDVAENLRRVAAALGISRERLYMTRQVHGRDVIVIEADQSTSQVAALGADACVSGAPGIACGVRTADCVPVLLGDPASGRVAAVHAGWRGAAANIIGASVETLALLGSRPRDLVAAFGPHISAAAFEVGDDVAAELERSAGGSGSVVRGRGQPQVDLARLVRAQLALSGLDASRIEQVEGCTFSDRLSFFSHRRDGSPGGRMLSAIVSREADAAHPTGSS
jgi:hypothetical protein